jgi:hypothetical protein
MHGGMRGAIQVEMLHPRMEVVCRGHALNGNRRAKGTHIGAQKGPTRVQEFTSAADPPRSVRALALVPQRLFRYFAAAG